VTFTICGGLSCEDYFGYNSYNTIQPVRIKGANHRTLPIPPVGCEISHHFNYIDSFSNGMRNNLKIRRFTILFALAKPIKAVNSIFGPAMKTRRLPLMRTYHISVFYRIVVDIIHMSGKILLVANQMFPESPLPNAALASFGSRCRHRHILSATVKP